MAFSNHDVKPDTPINNFATLNPLFINGTETTNASSSLSLSEGNLKLTADPNYSLANGTFTMRTGKWYWETYINTNVNYPMVGITHGTGTAENSYVGYDPNGNVKGISYSGDGSTYGDSNGDGTHAANNTATGLSTYTTGDIIGCFFDADIGSLKFFKNETLIRTESGINRHDWHPATSAYNGGINTVNFGQDPTFAGSKVPTKVYTDSNGQGKFFYEPPAGALALCTRNLATPQNVPAEYIVDETNQHLLTYNGNAQISKFSPYATDGYSMYSTETTGVNFGSVSDFNFLHDGTTSYTISGWIYRTKDSGSAQLILDTANFGSGNIGVYCSVGSNNLLNFQINRGVGGSATAYFDSNYAVPLNQWIYFAITHDTSITSGNDRIKLYINGVESGYNTRSYNYNNSASNSTRNLHLGVYDGTSLGFPGYISDLRIIKNVDAANYAVPTSYVSSTGTDFLLSANSKQFVDSSSNAYTSTLVGSPEISDWSPYTSIDKQTGYELVTTENGGSFYFDGSGDNLKTIDSTDWNPEGQDFTIEGWYYLKQTGAFYFMWGTGGSDGNEDFAMRINTDNTINAYLRNSAGTLSTFSSTSTIVKNTWNHIALERYNNVIKIYINGVAETNTFDATSWTGYNSETGMSVGAFGDYGSGYWNGYIADFRIVKGSAIYQGNFTPPTAKLTAVTNTKYLLQPFQPKDKINSSFFNVTDNYAQDETGKALTYVGNAAVSTSSPYKSGDYGSFAFSANTQGITVPATNNFNSDLLTIEYWLKFNGTSTRRILRSYTDGTNYWEISFDGSWGFYFRQYDNNAMTINQGIYDQWSASNNWQSNVWTHFVFQKNGTTWSFYKNGKSISLGNGSNIGAATTIGNYNTLIIGNTEDFTNGLTTGDYISDLRIVKGVALYTADFTPPAYPLLSNKYTTDGSDPANGTAITGTTVLLAQPGKVADSENVAAKDPDAYMKSVIWTGDGPNPRDIPIGFNPDFVWIKNRTGTANSHATFDSVRGFGKKHLWTDLTNGETANEFGHVSGVSNNNITVTAGTSDDIYVNNFGTTYVGWVWKAGGAPSGLNIYMKDDVGYQTLNAAGINAGTITPTAMSVNTKAGFSIVSYTGPGNGISGTLPHGLGKEPKFVITKSLNNTYNWMVYHKSAGVTHYTELNGANPFANNSLTYNGPHDSNVVKYGGTTVVAVGNFIAYIWAEIPGYSAFGSYTGNGSATDGPFVYTGFKPAWVMVKGTTTNNAHAWKIWNNASDTYNLAKKPLWANLTNPEPTGLTIGLDFLSNGFKIRSDDVVENASYNYIYAAFAEAPVPYATAR